MSAIEESLTHLQQWGALLGDGARILETAGVATPRRTARWLLEDTLGVTAARLVACPEQEASAEEALAFAIAIDRCRSHEPIQYILGFADFCGLRLRVTPEVFIPRPETECLVQVALDHFDGSRGTAVLDIGTGSGCIALVLKQECPEAHVVACDSSLAALRIAQSNGDTHGLAVTFVHANIFSPPPNLFSAGPFDLIVSNPPYIPDAELCTLPKNVRDFEPAEALLCGTDPLKYCRAMAGLGHHLRRGGTLVLETHTAYAAQVKQLLATSGYAEALIHRDWAGKRRIVTATRSD